MCHNLISFQLKHQCTLFILHIVKIPLINYVFYVTYIFYIHSSSEIKSSASYTLAFIVVSLSLVNVFRIVV